MPHGQVTDNLIIDALLLEAMHAEGIRRIIYLSSATVYQEFEGCIKEDELDWNQQPHEAYIGVGWAKRFAEKLCWFWHEKYGMEIFVVRCANIYGPYARFDPANSNFIPAIIRKSVKKMDPFEVWGNPEVRRDVIYTEDFAAAVISLLMHDEIKYGVYNLGFGKAVTVGEVVGVTVGAVVGESVGESVGPVLGEYVGDEVGVSVGDLVGVLVGDVVGDVEGDRVGETVGDTVGEDEGDIVGETVGE